MSNKMPGGYRQGSPAPLLAAPIASSPRSTPAGSGTPSSTDEAGPPQADPPSTPSEVHFGGTVPSLAGDLLQEEVPGSAPPTPPPMAPLMLRNAEGQATALPPSSATGRTLPLYVRQYRELSVPP